MKKENGITLIALVITIIVLLILAGVTIATLTGENGILNKAKNSSISTKLAGYKEELELYKQSKYMENREFKEESLTAGKNNLTYNTQKENEDGNIQTIITTIDNEYLEKLEIIKGKLLINTKNKEEVKIAQGLGIEVNPYDITEDGILESSNGNLLLMDEETGTLTIPDSVITIGEGAFSNVEGLKTIIIPSSVRKIAKNAFYNNSTLETVIMQEKDGKGVEIIGFQAFAQCKNLKTVKMPNTVTKIEAQAFYYDENLSEINLSNKLTEITDWCFTRCSKLKNITIPESIIKIQKNAFSECGNLEEINIPKNVNYINPTAFQECNKLQNITVDTENQYFELENGILLGNNKTEMTIILPSAIQGNKFSIPSTITNLYSGQLSNYKEITIIEIPASVINIESKFINDNITSVIIDEKNPIYYIYENAIYNKEKEAIIKYFGNDNQYTIKEGTKIIGNWSFSERYKLKQLEIPNSLVEIEYSAFRGCTNLKELSIGENLEKIKGECFLYTGIENITIDENNKNFTVKENCICNGKVSKAIYDKSGKTFITPIGIRENIVTYEVSNEVTTIHEYAFYNCYNLKNIKISNKIESIESQVFTFCNSLTKIEIPNSIKTIGYNAFSSADNLKEIIIDRKEGEVSGTPWGCVYGNKAIIWNN